MTQTANSSNGVVLERAEFYYLLRTYYAIDVIGLEGENLFPPPGPAADSLLDEGFARLQVNGWLTPIERPDRFDLNPELALLVAVVADPQFVVVSLRNLSETQRAMANHYLGADLIVELSLTPERNVRLAFVPDRRTLLERVEAHLAATPNPLAPARYSLDGPDFEAIQRLAGSAQSSAAQRLASAGLSTEHAQSLALALVSSVGDGTVLVVRTAAGEIFGGRKAAIHEGTAGAWLVRRDDSATTVLSIETAQAGSISGVIESFLQSLSILLEPVA